MLFVAIMVFLAWTLSNVVLLAFGSVLVAVLLRHLARILSYWLPLPIGVSLTLVVLGLALLASLFAVSAGARVAEQFDLLWESLPRAVARAREYIASYSWGRDLLEASGPRVGTLVNLATGLAGTLVSALTDAVMVIVVALFLAADPDPYRRGLLHLLPVARRARGAEVLAALDQGL
ncbi:AI-2E family transporter, partial [Geminicoccus harenae]